MVWFSDLELLCVMTCFASSNIVVFKELLSDRYDSVMYTNPRTPYNKRNTLRECFFSQRHHFNRKKFPMVDEVEQCVKILILKIFAADRTIMSGFTDLRYMRIVVTINDTVTQFLECIPRDPFINITVLRGYLLKDGLIRYLFFSVYFILF